MQKNKPKPKGVKDLLKMSVDGWKEIIDDGKKGMSWMTKKVKEK